MSEIITAICLWWIGTKLNAGNWYYILIVIGILIQSITAFMSAKRKNFMVKKEENRIEIILRGKPEEIADFVKVGNGVDRKDETAPTSKTAGRQDTDKAAEVSEREHLIQEYERRLALLKSGASPVEVAFHGWHC